MVDAKAPAAKVLVLRGDAGIGKTALWEWALRRATAAGQRVLVSRAGIAEAQLPWVALADLLSAVPVGTTAALPPRGGPCRS